jgi:hypothetical protein
MRATAGRGRHPGDSGRSGQAEKVTTVDRDLASSVHGWSLMLTLILTPRTFVRVLHGSFVRVLHG